MQCYASVAAWVLNNASLSPRVRCGAWWAQVMLGKLRSMASLYRPYTFHPARYSASATDALFRGCMNAAEREELPFDCRAINWDSYWSDVHIPGLRRYVMGQPIVLPIPMLKNSSAQAPKAKQHAASYNGNGAEGNGAGRNTASGPANNIVQGPVLPAHSHSHSHSGKREEASASH